MPIILVSNIIFTLQAASDHKDEFYGKLFNSRMLWDSPLTLAGAEQVYCFVQNDSFFMAMNCSLSQCEALSVEIEKSGLDVDAIFVSPLIRTLQVSVSACAEV